MDLKGNPCGKALLKVAGQELVNECKKIGSLQPGEMASTGPAKLNCKRVYHVRSSHWDNGNGALVNWFDFYFGDKHGHAHSFISFVVEISC